MVYAGLDIGSRTTILLLYDGKVRQVTVVDSGVKPLERCRQLLEGKDYQRLMVTGYGRFLVAPRLDGCIVSEISAYAAGACHIYKDCGGIIDIGGQDCKAISLHEGGGVKKFEMNDRCSAGTGRFLEIMADTLEVGLGELGGLALNTTRTVPINSLCTVFAESEVVSLIASGEEASAIAMGIHEAIASRIAGMVRRVGLRERIVFAGGAALNICLSKLIEDKLDVKLTVPENPQIIGALGAALLAEREQV